MSLKVAAGRLDLLASSIVCHPDITRILAVPFERVTNQAAPGGYEVEPDACVSSAALQRRRISG